MKNSTEQENFGPDTVPLDGEMTEEHAQAVLMRAEGATYAQIAEELEIDEDRAREYAPFPAQVNAGLVREDMRLAIVMGDRNKLAEAYEQYGVSIGEVINQHRECLYARQYWFDKETGQFFWKPDFKTRMTAVNSFWRAIGVIGEVAQEGDAAKPVEVHLHRDTVYKLQNLTGRPIVAEGEQSDRLESTGNGHAGDRHLPLVRTVAESLPQRAESDRGKRSSDAGDRREQRADATDADGGDTADWGDF